MYPSKSDGMFVPESLIFRSDSNGALSPFFPLACWAPRCVIPCGVMVTSAFQSVPRAHSARQLSVAEAGRSLSDGASSRVNMCSQRVLLSAS